MSPEKYEDRLICYQVKDNSFSCVENNCFDFFLSIGVLCHNNAGDIKNILKNSLPKMKVGEIAVHQYADWDKLDQYGWKRDKIPQTFKNMPDDQIWWLRNNQKTISSMAREAGWEVLSLDLRLVKRDSIIVMRRI